LIALAAIAAIAALTSSNNLVLTTCSGPSFTIFLLLLLCQDDFLYKLQLVKTKFFFGKS
jgi:hypothetical protein